MPKKSKPKVFITGGAGFIGSAIARNLSKHGWQVRTFDITEAEQVSGDHHVGTVMYADEIFRAMHGCEYVIHLAAMLGVRRTEQDRIQCLDINIGGTKSVLDACVKAGVKKVIFSSSSEVYGEPIKTPISETDAVSPKSVYAITKLAGEEYLKAYAKEYGFDYSIVRFFNVYGPGQVAEFVLPRFVKAVRSHTQPIIYGKGDQIRCFCHVDDAAEGLRLILESKKSHGHIFNVGNDTQQVTVKHLAERIIKHAGKGLELTYLDLNKSDRSHEREIVKRIPDISKARDILGYTPAISLDTGILQMLQSVDIKDTWTVPTSVKNRQNSNRKDASKSRR